MNFQEKVQSMTAKQIILSMVEGLKKQHVIIDMETYGRVHKNVCYGCAATNTICEISGITPKASWRNRLFCDKFAYLTKCENHFIRLFEQAIDALRSGNISEYNQHAECGRFAPIERKGLELPELWTDDYRSLLHYYERLAEAQD